MKQVAQAAVENVSKSHQAEAMQYVEGVGWEIAVDSYLPAYTYK